MNKGTLADVFETNDRVRARLIRVVSGLSEREAGLLTEKGDWTVAAIVEHLAKVEESMTRVSLKLVKKAEEKGLMSDGNANISGSFLSALTKEVEKKFEAPEIVRPEGKRSVAASLELMKKNRERLNASQEIFFTYYGHELTFPHPAFGEMTAHDWLALIGGHESRHIDQIERILSDGKRNK